MPAPTVGSAQTTTYAHGRVPKLAKEIAKLNGSAVVDLVAAIGAALDTHAEEVASSE